MKLGQVSRQPATSAAAVTGGAASPGGAPAVMPAFRVTVYPTASDNQYVTIGYHGMMPLWTADGGAVNFPAQDPRHARLRAAGRP